VFLTRQSFVVDCEGTQAFGSDTFERSPPAVPETPSIANKCGRLLKVVQADCQVGSCS
jgi:hypothetical protein